MVDIRTDRERFIFVVFAELQCFGWSPTAESTRLARAHAALHLNDLPLQEAMYWLVIFDFEQDHGRFPSRVERMLEAQEYFSQYVEMERARGFVG